MLKFISFVCFLKLAASQGPPDGVPKCSDFKPVQVEKMEDVLAGRWNAMRIYGMPTIPDDKKCSCVCIIQASTGEEHKMSSQLLMTEANGNIRNMTSIGTIINNAGLEIDEEKEFDRGGQKMKVHMHAVVK